MLFYNTTKRCRAVCLHRDGSLLHCIGVQANNLSKLQCVFWIVFILLLPDVIGFLHETDNDNDRKSDFVQHLQMNTTGRPTICFVFAKFI